MCLQVSNNFVFNDVKIDEIMEDPEKTFMLTICIQNFKDCADGLQSLSKYKVTISQSGDLEYYSLIKFSFAYLLKQLQ